MKVVLFCGGLGMRLREYSESIPKPMVPIGYRPILWHVMKYYAHFGHNEFILCLGSKSDVIKDYFLNYNECVSNDFTLTSGGSQISLFSSDIHDWKITFVDTGTAANVGQRLRAVRRLLEDEEVFLANYADGLTDVHLPIGDRIPSRAPGHGHVPVRQAAAKLARRRHGRARHRAIGRGHRRVRRVDERRLLRA